MKEISIYDVRLALARLLPYTVIAKDRDVSLLLYLMFLSLDYSPNAI